MKASTAALHADGEVSHGAAVGPDLSVSTTFRFPAPERSVPGVEDPEDRWADWDPHTPQADIYTRSVAICALGMPLSETQIHSADADPGRTRSERRLRAFDDPGPTSR